ncbi:universal stress protein [Benzoatithermus flavus]|uniref:Universal stress protein n=1 Tax=Benzoatithermus flavus TaxID=3108223 RepID=A0ABU8XXG0_9PROT
MYKHILLPTDGSALSRKAIRTGVQLAKALEARVTGLSVVVESPVAAGIGKAASRGIEPVAAAESFVQVIAEEARRQQVPHECFYVQAEAPYAAVIRTATAKGCDLICMASHGRRGIRGLSLGSETVHVLTHCKIPVLVCH